MAYDVQVMNEHLMRSGKIEREIRSDALIGKVIL